MPSLKEFTGSSARPLPVILLAVVTFGGTAALHVPLTPANDVRWTSMQAHGRTPLGAALDMATDLIEDRERLPRRAYRPTVVLVSDGLPNDEWEESLQRLLTSERAAKVERFALGIGADRDMLRRFLDDPERTGLRGPRGTRDQEILPVGDDECDLPLALREPDGRLLLAGLDDGLAIVRKAGGGVASFGGRSPDAFGNETLALGTPHRIDDWWIAAEPPGRGRTVVLAADGVADDLASERLEEFADWLARDVGRLAPAARWRRLCRELRTWPIPCHLNDKTVAVLVERPGGVS